jgi:tRNA(adenine34) deaminase
MGGVGAEDAASMRAGESTLVGETSRTADEAFVLEALREAELAREAGEVPVGCVVVHGGRIIARAHNQREMLRDPTAHAEMVALTQAAAELGSWRLEGSAVYVTLEPCAMCAGALVLARVERLVYGAADPKAGAVESIFRILDEERLNHRVAVTGGVLSERCGAVLAGFFRERRRPPAPPGPGS